MLIARFGERHPAVRRLDQEISALHKPGASKPEAEDSVQALAAERRQLAAAFGENHPAVRSLDQRLSILRAKDAQIPESADAALQDLDRRGLDARELRVVVRALINRIVRLEDEIQELKDGMR